MRRRIWMLFALWVALQSVTAQGKFITVWTLSENQANIKHGGRANTIAVHPADPNQMFVASESGGLFKSTDRGLHWKHVDSLPVIYTQAVAYLPSNPDILLASAEADFKTTNGGGVWRSADGGVTWTQAQLNIPGFTGRLSAHEISIMPGTELIVVATTRGVVMSSDTGLTWTYSNVFGAGDMKVLSVLARPGRVYAGGPAGVRFAAGNPLGPWTSPVTNLGGIFDIHALGKSALDTSQAFVVNGSAELFFTQDGGMSWTEIPSAPPPDPGAGGISFIKTTLHDFLGLRFLTLYFGNRLWMHRLVAPVNGNTPDFSGTWQPVDIEHADTRDLAFVGNDPVLLATDSGLHNTNDHGFTWLWVGGGREGGFNALQIYEVDGQYIEELQTTDLYFGTQDNNLWATNIWATVYNQYGAEGFFIEAERRVPKVEDAIITYVGCGGCQNNISERHFFNWTPWRNPPTLWFHTPVLIRRQHYVQGITASNGIPSGLADTTNQGVTWWQYAVFDQERWDLARLGRSGEGDPNRTTILYQTFRTNTVPGWTQGTRLIRTHKQLDAQGTASVFFPAMNGFGLIGTNSTVFVPKQVYGIDPGDAFHIIAPDVVNQRMMQTFDGGENWTEIPGLADLVTDNGKYVFRTNRGAGEPVFPHATAVSFSPQDPRLVLIGTNEGGILVSNDNGATWKKIPGTELATKVTGFFWKDTNTVYVSTYGRGLWRLRNVRIALPDAFDELCGTCDVVSNDGGPDRPRFDGSILVFEGNVLGVRTENGQLREVFVKPSSSVIFTGDQEDLQDDITITESDGRDPKIEPLPVHPKGWIAKGVVFTKGDMLTGAVFGDSEATLLPPISPKIHEGSRESPTKGKPYIRLITAQYVGMATAAPNETFEVDATDFVAGATYEVLIDGVAPKDAQVKADGNGSFKIALSAPVEKGHHTVDVRLAGDGKVLDGSVLVVRHQEID